MMIDLAILIVAFHAAWLLLVIFGALWTRGRPFWSAAHIAALIWGIVVEVGPWPCPLTLAESHFEAVAGAAACQASPLLRLLDNIVYPNLAGWIVASAGAAVCIFNLGIYSGRMWRGYNRRRMAQRG
ncbi:MAG: DUF2784 family protein [Terracidiphilus sp.]